MLSKLAQQADLNLAGLARLLDILEDQGWVTQKRGRYRLIEADLDPDAVPLEAEARRLAHARSRRDMMRAYAEVHGCRRRFLRNYLGEYLESEDGSGHCDNDSRKTRRDQQPHSAGPAEALPFVLQQPVEHEAWGKGIIHRMTADTVAVLFDTAGYKTLATDLVVAEGSLR